MSSFILTNNKKRNNDIYRQHNIRPSNNCNLCTRHSWCNDNRHMDIIRRNMENETLEEEMEYNEETDEFPSEIDFEIWRESEC